MVTNCQLRAAGALLALAALGCDDYRRCEQPPREQLAAMPALLSETGLYANAETEELASGVRSFRPASELWSDGAQKARWIWLPPGAQIDTRDMDDWQFPRGTKLWKQFTRDGTRVETRLLHKLGDEPDSWIGAAYAFRDDDSDAELTIEGVTDARSTPHDVPAASQCAGCHRGRSSFALGFSAIQLAHASEPEGVALSELFAAGLLTDPPADEPRIPGDATERAALAYLHANCGHCHNSARPEQGAERCFDPENRLDFWLRTDSLEQVSDTPTYESATAHDCVDPGRPDSSQMIRRISDRDDSAMPPLATEQVDVRAVALLRRWIEQM